MDKNYSIYKPLRNFIRKVDLWTGLHAVYSFAQYLDYDVQLPEQYRLHYPLSRRDKMMKGLVQWEFEILARELILNAKEKGGLRFANWADVARAANHIKKVENDMFGAHEGHQDDVLYEIVRIAHRQFPWQVGISQEYIARYHWLYRQDGLKEAFERIFGMTNTEMMQIGLALVGHLLSNSAIKLPIRNNLNDVCQNTIEKFIENMSTSIEDARAFYRANQQYNVNWAYTFNILREKPLIRVSDGHLICPLPNLLLWRLTTGVYYDLVKVKDVNSKYLGPAVQQMIAKIAQTHLTEDFRVVPEAKYHVGKNEKSSIDWIIESDTGTLFIEVKAARVSFKGISDLTDTSSMASEFSKMREFARKAYATINDALNGKYEHWQPKNLPAFLMIVTLEDWQSLGFHVEREVFGPLRADLEKLGIDTGLIDRVPMTFCPAADFEIALYVAKKIGIADLLSPKNKGEYPQWMLHTYITTEFQGIFSEYQAQSFKDEWDLLKTR